MNIDTLIFNLTPASLIKETNFKTQDNWFINQDFRKQDYQFLIDQYGKEKVELTSELKEAFIQSFQDKITVKYGDGYIYPPLPHYYYYTTLHHHYSHTLHNIIYLISLK